MTTIIGDYKAQFGQISDYLHKVYKKNLETTIKVKTFKDGETEHVFKFLYVCPGLFKKCFLDGCRRVISLDACFFKAALE